ncbi:MAG: coproporphyrinogen III oxidase [Bacteroidetes bacterium]|nr:MAG: coproporphyrinogen III oxidase [Bacteroidota bacterium]
MIRDFLSGMTAYARAWGLISELRLWKFVFIPGILSLLLGGLIVTSAWGLSDDLGGYLIRWYPWEWGRTVIEKIAEIFSGLIVLAGGLIAYKQLILIISAPFMSPLSEAVERHLAGELPDQRFSLVKMGRDLWRGIRLGIRNGFREIMWTVILLILGLIPVFSPFTTAGIFLVQAYFFGFGNMDFTLERHFGVRDSVRFVQRHRWLAIGNGVVTMLLMMTVVGFLFILPFGTVAATIETTKRIARTRE